MSDVLLLDSGLLGLITQPQRSHEVIAITDWLKDCVTAGARVLVPAIVYYEIKRELLRANKTVGIARLGAFVNAAPDRHVPLTDDALRLAAELWAPSRQAGRPTAAPAALDIDVLIAAQSIRLGGAPVIATTNSRHLSQFIPRKPNKPNRNPSNLASFPHAPLTPPPQRRIHPLKAHPKPKFPPRRASKR